MVMRRGLEEGALSPDDGLAVVLVGDVVAGLDDLEFDVDARTGHPGLHPRSAASAVLDALDCLRIGGWRSRGHARQRPAQ